jgi:hypothetical protein
MADGKKKDLTNPLFRPYPGNKRSTFPQWVRRGLKIEGFKLTLYLTFPICVVVAMLHPTSQYYLFEVCSPSSLSINHDIVYCISAPYCKQSTKQE